MKRIVLILLIIVCVSGLVIPGYATPSVVTTPPSIVPDGEEGGEIIEELGMTIIKPIKALEIYLTPFSDRADKHYPLLTDEENAMVTVRLEEVFDDLLANEGDLGNLIPGLDDLANGKSTNRLIRNFHFQTNSGQYYATDLFDLTSLTEYVQLAAQENLKFRVKLKIDLKDEEETPVFGFCDQLTGEYSLIPASDVTRNEDNTITIVFPAFGDVIIMKKGNNVQTGDSTILWLLLAIVSLAIVALIVYIARRERKYRMNQPERS